MLWASFCFRCCLTLSVVLSLDKGDYHVNSHVVFCPDKQHSFEPFMCEGCTDSLHSDGHTTLTGSDSATRQLCLLLKEQSDQETPFKASVELTL